MLKSKLVPKGLNYNITVQIGKSGFEIIKKIKWNEIWTFLGSTLASFWNDGIVVISNYSQATWRKKGQFGQIHTVILLLSLFFCLFLKYVNAKIAGEKTVGGNSPVA